MGVGGDDPAAAMRVAGEMSLQVPPSYEQYSERPMPGGLLRFAPYPGVAAYLRRRPVR
jgi:hypothetical protein